MLLRPGGIPSGDGWAFELKYNGFRAIVSTEDGLQIRSRRAWNMSDRVPELRELVELYAEKGDPKYERAALKYR